jgi:hypothetical protein
VLAEQECYSVHEQAAFPTTQMSALPSMLVGMDISKNKFFDVILGRPHVGGIHRRLLGEVKEFSTWKGVIAWLTSSNLTFAKLLYKAGVLSTWTSIQSKRSNKKAFCM